MSMNRKLSRSDHFLDSKVVEIIASAILAVIIWVTACDYLKTPTIYESWETGQIVVQDSSGNVLTNVPEGTGTRSDHIWVP